MLSSNLPRGRLLLGGILGIVLALGWFWQPLPAWGGEPAKNAGELTKPGSWDRSLDHAKVKRTYRLHVPKDFTPGTPVPLVIVLHGLGANGKIMDVLTGFSSLADRKGFAVVYPDGLKLMWRFWGNEDVGFIKALIDQLVKEGIADTRRVYITGISNGAYMTNRLACDLTDCLAGVAPVAGTMLTAISDLSKPKRPLPVLYIHGTDDTFVGYDGKDFLTKQGFSLPAEKLVRWWARHNRCGEQPTVEKLASKADDKITVERHSFRPEPTGAEVVFYKLGGGGHTWPGGALQPEIFLGKTCRSLNASEVMWEFFSRAQRP